LKNLEEIIIGSKPPEKDPTAGGQLAKT